jgi:hypothetical protein
MGWTSRVKQSCWDYLPPRLRTKSPLALTNFTKYDLLLEDTGVDPKIGFLGRGQQM